VFWNGWILFFIEGGLEFTFAFFIEWSTLSERWDSFVLGSYISIVLATLFFLGFLMMAFFTRCYLIPKHKELDEEEVEESIGEAYSGLDT
jgi:hypothetical protein